MLGDHVYIGVLNFIEASAGVTIDEGVQIMRDAWRDGVVTFDGKHYQVDGAIVRPTLLALPDDVERLT